MADDTGEFAPLWGEVDQKLKASETNAEDEERERRDFMSRFRVVANRTIRPLVDRAAQGAQASRYKVTPSQDRDVTEGKVVLRAQRPGKVASVYPGELKIHEMLESTLTFTADPARQLVTIEIGGADVDDPVTKDLVLDGVDEHTVRHWIGVFIRSLNPKTPAGS